MTALEKYEDVLAFIAEAHGGEMAWGVPEWIELFTELIELADAALAELADKPNSLKRKTIIKKRAEAIAMVDKWTASG